jgi:hypothetical protein
MDDGFRNDCELSAVDGEDWLQTARYFLDEAERLQGEGADAESDRGPPDWKSVIRKHREVLNISLDPPETKRILLKTKKFVNASLRWRRKKI